jgi:hypothetical protein
MNDFFVRGGKFPNLPIAAVDASASQETRRHESFSVAQTPKEFHHA